MRNVAFFLCILVAIIGPRIAPAQVLINEILADPASDWDGDAAVGSRDDEWVEIVNVGSAPVDLSGLRLGDSAGGYDWRYGFSTTLPAGAVLVVYGSESLAWEALNGFPAYGLSLNNSGDTVYLYELSEGDTTVIDAYTYASFEVADDRATGRMPDGSATWSVFDGLNPYTGSTPPLGSGCLPSPGHANDCTIELPVEHETWGAIKALYHG
jgi:hypothetical protein